AADVKPAISIIEPPPPTSSSSSVKSGGSSSPVEMKTLAIRKKGFGDLSSSSHRDYRPKSTESMESEELGAQEQIVAVEVTESGVALKREEEEETCDEPNSTSGNSGTTQEKSAPEELSKSLEQSGDEHKVCKKFNGSCFVSELLEVFISLEL
ncbi:unnamed protein product, partial [Anisakis simplex]|uniref:Retinitis pigmentosa 1-like 1 n=1 Tax=Anisakis simplex TaxID=6269 RepID=A0A0M3JKP2_ANISI